MWEVLWTEFPSLAKDFLNNQHMSIEVGNLVTREREKGKD